MDAKLIKSVKVDDCCEEITFAPSWEDLDEFPYRFEAFFVDERRVKKVFYRHFFPTEDTATSLMERFIDRARKTQQENPFQCVLILDMWTYENGVETDSFHFSGADEYWSSGHFDTLLTLQKAGVIA